MSQALRVYGRRLAILAAVVAGNALVVGIVVASAWAAERLQTPPAWVVFVSIALLIGLVYIGIVRSFVAARRAASQDAALQSKMPEARSADSAPGPGNEHQPAFWPLFVGIVGVALGVVPLAIGGWRGWFQLNLVAALTLLVSRLAFAWQQRPPPLNLWDLLGWASRIVRRDPGALGGLALGIVSILSLVGSASVQQVRITELSFSPTSPSDAEEVRITACAKGGDPDRPLHLRVQVNAAKDGSGSGAWETIAELPVGCVRGEEAPKWATLKYADGPHRVRVQARRPTEAWGKGAVRYATYRLLPRRPPPTEPTSPSATVLSATGTVVFRWEPALNAEQYHVRIYRGSDQTRSPILDQTLPSETLSFTHMFRADEPELSWMVTASNDVGRSDSPLVRFALDRKGALREGLLDTSDAPPAWSDAPVPDFSAFEDANYCGVAPNLADLQVEARVAFQSLPLVGERVDHGVAVFEPGRAKTFLDGIDDAQSRCRRTDRIVRGVRFVGTVDRRSPPLLGDQVLAFTEHVKSQAGTTTNGEVIYARRGDLVYILAVSTSGLDGPVPEANRGLADHLATIAMEKLAKIP